HFETQSRRFEYHFGCVLPSRRRQLNSPDRVYGEAPHPAVNVRVTAAVNSVEDPGRERCPEIAMQTRHRSGFDRSLASRTHYKLCAGTKRVDKGLEIPKIVR